MAIEQPFAPDGTSAGPRAGFFDIVVEFGPGAWAARFQDAFLEAAARIGSAVTGDLPDMLISTADGVRVVDDLLIRAELPEMDGEGGLLGLSVPDLLRPGSLLPVTAAMSFDAADAASLDARGLWDEVVLHEMLHCLGFGTLWATKGLVAPEGGSYVGPAGMAAYAAMGGDGPVPLETEGGDGTAGLHWLEEAFGAELMTGWAEDGGSLSPLTLASLSDLGYVLG